jgi:hypothetical protein
MVPLDVIFSALCSLELDLKSKCPLRVGGIFYLSVECVQSFFPYDFFMVPVCQSVLTMAMRQNKG